MSVGDIKSEAVGTAARYNDGKPDFSLVPMIALEECAKVFDYGRKKYSEWNWLKGQDWSHPYASLMRHLSAWQQGEEIDPESGLPHLGHAMCNMVMLSTFAKTYPEGDNRPNKKYFTREEVTPIGDKDTTQTPGRIIWTNNTDFEHTRAEAASSTFREVYGNFRQDVDKQAGD